MQAIDSAIQAALDAGILIKRGMIVFEFGSGIYAFWDGSAPLVWNAITFNPHNSLLDVSPVNQSGNLASSALTVTLRAVPAAGLTPDVLSTIEDEDYKNRPVTIYNGFFDAQTRTLLGGAPVVIWEGEVDTITHRQARGDYHLVTSLESRSRDYTRKGARLRGNKDQQNLFAGDGFLKHADNAATSKEYFGQGTPSTAQSGAS